MSKLYFKLLNENQKKVLEILSNFSKYGILGGGTALMLQLSHRYSYDFDIFLPDMVSKNFVYKVRQYFKEIELIADGRDEFSFTSFPNKIKISFIYYPFYPLYKTIPTPYLDFFSWREIALDKTYTIGRRGEWRDYVDLYFIIKNKFPLNRIIEETQKKFKDSFSKKLFLSQLTYFGDIKDFAVDFIGKKHSQREIENFLRKEVRKYKKEILL